MNGSILCSLGLRAGNIDVVERLLAHGTALAGKQNTVIDNSLEIRHVRLLQAAIDSKQALLSELAGTGVGVLYGTKLRRIFGSGGITVSHSLNSANLNDPSNFQIQVSGEELQTAISALQQTVSGLSTSSFLPRVGPASFTGNLQVQSMKITHVLLTPYLLAPEENIELCIRNYWNSGGLSISNATGQVHFPTGLTTGMAAIWEGNTQRAT